MFIVILNPASGSAGKPNLAPRLLQLFHAQGADARILNLDAGRPEATIREALAAKPEAVVAGGGDGTLNCIATVLAGTDIPLGILALGTLNHFARDLKIPPSEEGAVKAIVARHVAKVDVGYVNDRAFINNSSIGIYPSLVEIREQLRRQGHRKWLAHAMAMAKVLRRGHEISVRVEASGTHIKTRTPFLFVGNNEYTIEGIRLGTRSRLDAGRLHIYLAPRLHTRDLPKAFLWALLGHSKDRGAFEQFSATEMWLETLRKRRIHVSTDGEVTTLQPPLHYRIAPRALNVIVPAG